jgi:hypothetical protein
VISVRSQVGLLVQCQELPVGNWLNGLLLLPQQLICGEEKSMKVTKPFVVSKFFLSAVCLLAILFFALPRHAGAQCNTSQGFNAVYGSCGSPQGSFAMVDASQFTGAGIDICTAIQGAFNSGAYHKPGINGIVVDARGFGPGTSQYCSDNPWNPTAVIVTPSSSVVLLPSGIIYIAKTWALPPNTRLIGEGPNLTTLQTCTVALCNSNFSGADMVDMGNSTICPNVGGSGTNDCPGVVIEHLGLNGANATVNGIVNGFSQELSYVDDVAFNNISNYALEITTKLAANSGPYSKLAMSNVGTCVEINNGGSASTAIYGIRGIHGLTCNSATANPAIYLEGTNNIFEDVSIVGTSTSTQDGILVGGSTTDKAATETALLNIQGSGLKNVIHLSGYTNSYSSTTQAPCPFSAPSSSTAYNVCDATILGVTNGGGAGTNSIQDDVINTTVSDTNVGMYVLGEPTLGGSSPAAVGTTRLTTSPNFPVWLVGTTAPSGMGTCVPTGSLYSRTSGGTSPSTLYGCIGTTWTVIK